MFLKDMSVFTALTRNMEWLSARQKVLSQNIANADTPGYRARDLEKLSFQELLANRSDSGIGMTSSAALDSAARKGKSEFRLERLDEEEATPNANTVVLEDEILKVNDARMSYDLATSLYRKHVQMLKMAIGGRGG